MHRSVVDTRYGLSASERRVGSVMIIGGEEPVERSGASVVGRLGAHVCLVLKQSAVEPFDLAVGLGPVAAVRTCFTHTSAKV